ncbi:hypothetical protein DFH27DRAFT_547022 [Peziza echinospora]|nr:hypothetical protein DFH27DRAFT_547022 [Peziza echinospora]
MVSFFFFLFFFLFGFDFFASFFLLSLIFFSLGIVRYRCGGTGNRAMERWEGEVNVGGNDVVLLLACVDCKIRKRDGSG